jgi:hypothetical protein
LIEIYVRTAAVANVVLGFVKVTIVVVAKWVAGTVTDAVDFAAGSAFATAFIAIFAR